MNENKGWDFGKVGEAEARCGHGGDLIGYRTLKGAGR